MDNKLSWKEHIHYINLKISTGIGILAKMRHFVSKPMLKMLHSAFIQPHVNYGILNWGSAATSNLTPIRTSMNKAIRIMCYGKRREPLKTLYLEFKILNFDNSKLLYFNKFMWKLTNNKIPTPIESIFTKRISRLTGKEEFALPIINTEYKKRFVSYLGVKMWRETPTEIKTKPTLKRFQKKLYEHLLQKQC